MNIDKSEDEKIRDSVGPPTEKKPYKAPSFRFESVFEVSALACGKTFGSEASCIHSRKAS